MTFLLMTRPGCVNSAKAKAILRDRKQGFSVSDHDTPEKIARFKEAGYTRFPVIFHKGVYIGDHEDLLDHLEQ